ncbi:MAG: BREX-6 system phosphatase PglZ [Anaeromyxobacteraceae bacterium]
MTGGLIGSALESELLTELRRNGIVVWLDAAGAFGPFVDGLRERHSKGDFAFPVAAFRGSFLELMVALEPFEADLDPSPLLVHMPGFTEETIRSTPVLELYRAGVRFRKAPETLVREVAAGKVAPAALEQFLAKGPPSLAAADEWLSSQMDSSREGLAGNLDSLGAAFVLGEAVTVLNGTGGYLASRVTTQPEREVLAAFLERQTGMDADWLAWFPVPVASGGQEPSSKSRLGTILDAWTGWLLAVEYVHDLTRPPHLPELQRLASLSPQLVKACRGLVERLRAEKVDAYERLADDVEDRLKEEFEGIGPEDLGKVDTFRVEESSVLRAAVKALGAREWSKAREWAEHRTDERSFWLKRDLVHRDAWAMVREAADLGVTLATHPRPLDGARTLAEAVGHYTGSAYEVDRAHRRFEQRQVHLLGSQLPHLGELKGCVRSLRLSYREWADQLARDFTKVCKSDAFLPEDSLQQRTLFDQVVLPLASEGRVAFFLIDAFRYEMATELLRDLEGAGTVVDLKARLAELPTITSVGMNALPPVAQAGRLRVAGTFEGFKTGEFTVRLPEDRARAIGTRTGGKQSVRLQLEDVCDLEPDALKRKIASANVIVVHGTELDDAGEAGVGRATFEGSLGRIRDAWALLQKAGVKNFVFTADHGFLLLDETTRTVPFGKKTDPSPRYVLDDHPRAEDGMVNVSLSALGYDGLGGHLLFREDTALFRTGAAGANFVHGGNSLQERVIPVLTVHKSRSAAGAQTAFEVEVEKRKDLMGVRRIAVRVRTAPGQMVPMDLAGRKAVALAIRAVDRPDVRAVLKDLDGAGTIQDGVLRLPVEREAVLCFTLEGRTQGAAQVELYHPEGTEQVAPRKLEDWFDVDFRRGTLTVPAVVPERILVWSDALPDDGTRRVFAHLAEHGSVTEGEVTGFLGSPRAFRRFSLAFEEYAAKVPFKVRIETASDGKRYVKEEEK